MDSIKNWLNLAKKHKIELSTNTATDELSICVNLVSIPESDAVAVAITVMKDHKKKNALPPWAFSKVMGIFERIMRDIDEGLIKDSNFYKPISLDTEWYKVIPCHRIFFIPEISVYDFIATLLLRNKLVPIKTQGIAEVSLMANTSQYFLISTF